MSAVRKPDRSSTTMGTGTMSERPAWRTRPATMGAMPSIRQTTRDGAACHAILSYGFRIFIRQTTRDGVACHDAEHQARKQQDNAPRRDAGRPSRDAETRKAGTSQKPARVERQTQVEHHTPAQRAVVVQALVERQTRVEHHTPSIQKTIGARTAGPNGRRSSGRPLSIASSRCRGGQP